jgi:type III pantothenate kinase
MFLAVNIGNTNIQMGVFVDNKLVCCLVFPTCKNPAPNYYKAILQELSGFPFKSIAICSVVASLTKPFRKLFKKHFKIEPLIIRQDLNSGLKILYRKKQLGADRIANAAGAYYLYKRGCIVVDMGTAITFDVVSPKGVYLGGAIAPGVGISSDALFSNTSLPRPDNFEDIKFVIGKDTDENLKAGILHGFSCMVDGILYKFKKELKFKPYIVLTGGDASLVNKIITRQHAINPFLTLEGIKVINEKHLIRNK